MKANPQPFITNKHDDKLLEEAVTAIRQAKMAEDVDIALKELTTAKSLVADVIFRVRLS